MRQPVADGQLRGVHDADEQAAPGHELAQVREAGRAQARAHVVGRIDLADVRGEGRRLPGKGVAPARHARDDRRRRPPHGRKDDHVPARPQRGRGRHRLHADVVVGELELVERHPPPALVLRAEPAVEKGHARRAQGMRLHGRRGGQGVHLEAQLVRDPLRLRRADTADEERAAGELRPCRAAIEIAYFFSQIELVET